MVAILVCGAVGMLAIAGLICLRYLRRAYMVVTVSGRSMEPTLWAGDRLLVRRVPTSVVRRGQIVVFGNSAASRWTVKRVLAVPGDRVPNEVALNLRDSEERMVPSGQMVVLGDNPAESTDSREWGYLSTEWLQGIVVRRIGSASRTGHRAGGDSLSAR